jgi:site-specific DNA-cytosine methylase
MRADNVAELKKVAQARKRTFIIAKRKDLKELLSEFGDRLHVIQERLAYALLVIK